MSATCRANSCDRTPHEGPYCRAHRHRALQQLRDIALAEREFAAHFPHSESSRCAALSGCSRPTTVPGLCRRHLDDLLAAAGRASMVMLRRQLLLVNKPVCAAPGCVRFARFPRRGTLCHGHQMRQSQGLPLTPLRPPRSLKHLTATSTTPRMPGGATGPCRVEVCEREAAARGLCLAHYKRAVANNGDPGTSRVGGRPPPPKTCTRDGCDRAHARRGLCRRHLDASRHRPPACTSTGCTATASPDGRCPAHPASPGGARPTCEAPECPRVSRRFGLCERHHAELRAAHERCSTPGCTAPHYRHGLCSDDFRQARRRDYQLAA